MEVVKKSGAGWSKTYGCIECESKLKVRVDDFTRYVNDFREGDAVTFICVVCKRENWIAVSSLPSRIHHLLPK